MPAAAARQAGGLAEDLGHHLVKVDALGHGDVVRAVGGGDDVRSLEVGADTHGAGLLAVGKVHLAGDRPLGHVEHRRLAFHVDALDGFLHVAAGQHLLIHPQALRVVGLGHGWTPL